MIKRFRRLEMPEPEHVRGGGETVPLEILQVENEAELRRALKSKARDLYEQIMGQIRADTTDNDLAKLVSERVRERVKFLTISGARISKQDLHLALTDVLTAIAEEEVKSGTNKKRKILARTIWEVLEGERWTETSATHEETREKAAA